MTDPNKSLYPEAQADIDAKRRLDEEEQRRREVKFDVADFSIDAFELVSRFSSDAVQAVGDAGQSVAKLGGEVVGSIFDSAFD